VPGGDDPDAEVELALDLPTWAALYAGDTTATEAERAGTLTITGDRARLAEFFGAFDHPHLVRTIIE
jgi:putative sterol carrier protein